MSRGDWQDWEQSLADDHLDRLDYERSLTHPWVLRVVGMATAGYQGPDPGGQYVVGCDVDAHDGRGDATLTEDPDRARGFRDPVEALAYWKRPSSVRPVREDGRANRPLTAFTVAVEKR